MRSRSWSCSRSLSLSINAVVFVVNGFLRVVASNGDDDDDDAEDAEGNVAPTTMTVAGTKTDSDSGN